MGIAEQIDYNPDMGVLSEWIYYTYSSRSVHLPFTSKSYYEDSTTNICLFKCKDYILDKYNIDAVKNSIKFIYDKKDFTGDGGPLNPIISDVYFSEKYDGLYLYATVTNKAPITIGKDLYTPYINDFDPQGGYYMFIEPVIYIDGSETFSVLNFDMSNHDIESYTTDDDSYSIDYKKETKKVYFNLQVWYDEPGANWEWTIKPKNVEFDEDGVIVVTSVTISGGKYDFSAYIDIGYKYVYFSSSEYIIGDGSDEPVVTAEIEYFVLTKRE